MNVGQTRKKPFRSSHLPHIILSLWVVLLFFCHHSIFPLSVCISSHECICLHRFQRSSVCVWHHFVDLKRCHTQCRHLLGCKCVWQLVCLCVCVCVCVCCKDNRCVFIWEEERRWNVNIYLYFYFFTYVSASRRMSEYLSVHASGHAHVCVCVCAWTALSCGYKQNQTEKILTGSITLCYDAVQPRAHNRRLRLTLHTCSLSGSASKCVTEDCDKVG